MSEVKGAIEGWQDGNEVAAMWVCQWLWQQLWPIVQHVFKRTDAFAAAETGADRSQTEAEDKGGSSAAHGARNAEHFVDDGFWAALEELELLLNPRKPFWTAPTPATKQVKNKDKDDTETRRVFEGRVTGRLLTRSDTWQWQSTAQFERLFRDIWIKRARNALAKEARLRNHLTTRSKLPSPTSTVGDASVFFPPTAGCASLEATREATTPTASGAAYEDEIAGQAADAQRVAVDRSALLNLVEGLAQWAEQLRGADHTRLHQTVEALLRYVKAHAARTHPQYATASQQELQHVKIEDILMSSNVSCLDFDEEDAWQFVQDALGLRRDTVYKRKQRLRSLLQSPSLPQSLRAAAGLRWWASLLGLVDDCRKTATRVDARSREALALIDLFLRWTWAQGHPSHRHRPDLLTWVTSVPLQELFACNNPHLLVPRYPGAGTFQPFVVEHYPDHRGLVDALPRLRDTLKQLHERPIRLITMIEAWL